MTRKRNPILPDEYTSRENEDAAGLAHARDFVRGMTLDEMLEGQLWFKDMESESMPHHYEHDGHPETWRWLLYEVVADEILRQRDERRAK